MNIHECKVYVRVNFQGNLSRNERMTVREAHEANFVVVWKDDKLFVWKDRYSDYKGELTRAEADSRAHDFVDVARGDKKASIIYQFGRR